MVACAALRDDSGESKGKEWEGGGGATEPEGKGACAESLGEGGNLTYFEVLKRLFKSPQLLLLWCSLPVPVRGEAESRGTVP